MKKIQLTRLVLTNFKGIKHFELNANGRDIGLFGDNGSGKTTVFDAATWLLFDKDSNNASKFDIKTLENGKVIHKLNHEVEAVIQIEDPNADKKIRVLTLKKVFSEKWTKKRGPANKTEFTGHTTKYFVNGVPSKQQEYKEVVAEMVNEEVFKLLTNPRHFNEKLDKKERRNLLFEIIGDVTDEDVFNSSEELKKLEKILDDRTVEGHQIMVNGKRKEINEELERIPIRIEEINRNLPDVGDLDQVSINTQLSDLNTQIDAKQEQINDIKNGSEINKLKAEISDINLQISTVKNQHAQAGQTKLFSVKARLQEEKSNYSILNSELENVKNRKKYNDSDFNDIEQRLKPLRAEYEAVEKEDFISNDECECPTCGQDLPEEQVASAKEKASSQFNLNKSKKLEAIRAKGKQGANQKKEILQANEKLEKEYEKLNGQITEKQTLIAKLEVDVQTLEKEVSPIEENEMYNKLINEKQILENQINQLDEPVNESVKLVQQEIASLKEKQGAFQIDLSTINQTVQSKARIAELEAQEKELAAEFEKLEEELYLTEEFTRVKVGKVSEKISGKFKYARFKLFEDQINGGLNEMFETLYEGVPYSSGLNTAAQINVGLDIINTLSQHYGVQAPIFVDNAESVTQLIDIDAQVISLVVSEQDKQLRIESKQGKESEVA